MQKKKHNNQNQNKLKQSIEMLAHPAQNMSSTGIFPDDPVATGSTMYHSTKVDGAQPIAGTTRDGLREWAGEHEL